MERNLSFSDRQLTKFKYETFAKVLHLFQKDSNRGGATIAYAPELATSTSTPRGKFARVAIAWCAPEDQYSRKVGERIALRRLMDFQSVLLPIYSMQYSPEQILRDMFVDAAASQVG